MPPNNRSAEIFDEVEYLASHASSDLAALCELLSRTVDLRRHIARVEASGRKLDPMISPDDISQDVALEVVTSIHRYDRERGRFAAWLTGITRHIISRRSRDRPSTSVPAWLAPPQLAVVALRETVSSDILEADERQLLSMVAVGCTIRDVAEMLGISDAAASKRIQRLRARLEPNVV